MDWNIPSTAWGTTLPTDQRNPTEREPSECGYVQGQPAGHVYLWILKIIDAKKDHIHR